MELKMSEVNTTKTINSFNYNSYQENEDNYWENIQVKEPKRKKVSFDDILSNMNLVVNNQGVLQHMGPISQEDQSNQSNQYPHQYQPQQNKNNDPLDTTVKHSYIFNKYFKDYKDQSQIQTGPRVPKTMEEYKQMLADDRIKAIQHKQYIDQVKSKKMMFVSSPETIHNPRNIQSTKNTLRSMSFH
jgi:hypothetical protein